jgi:glycosidase
MQMNLLGTHDTERILTILGEGRSEGMSNSDLAVCSLDPEHRSLAIKRLKAAYTVIATLPGIPAIYYADEAGLEGYKDPFNRRPFPWKKSEAELVEHYRRIGEIREKYSAYKSGDFKVIALTDDVLIFTRQLRASVLITAMNNSSKTLEFHFDKPAEALIDGEKACLISLPSGIAQVIKTTENNRFDFDFI